MSCEGLWLHAEGPLCCDSAGGGPRGQAPGAGGGAGEGGQLECHSVGRPLGPGPDSGDGCPTVCG